jgi:hypothetical protein
MRRWPSRRAALVAASVAACLLGGCGDPPRYQFASSSADDVVIRLPWHWAQVRSGPPVASDGTTATDGSWYAVYDADPHPSLSHATTLSRPAPVVLARTVVIDKSVGAAVTDDELRDVTLPVTPAGRAAQAPAGADFTLLLDQTVQTRTERGVHVLFTYDLGSGPEVFDQVAVLDTSKTRVHVLLVHCTRSCFDTNKNDIVAAVNSFTVKAP